jgi:hypothetical protein
MNMSQFQPPLILTACFPNIHLANLLTLVAEQQGSTLLIPKPATEHGQEPVPTNPFFITYFCNINLPFIVGLPSSSFPRISTKILYAFLISLS